MTLSQKNRNWNIFISTIFPTKSRRPFTEHFGYSPSITRNGPNFPSHSSLQKTKRSESDTWDLQPSETKKNHAFLLHAPKQTSFHQKQCSLKRWFTNRGIAKQNWETMIAAFMPSWKEKPPLQYIVWRGTPP